MTMGSAGGHTDHMAPSDDFAACCGILKKKKSHFILSEKHETEMSFPLLEASSAFRKDQRTRLKDLGISEPYFSEWDSPVSAGLSPQLSLRDSLPTPILVSSLIPRCPALP